MQIMPLMVIVLAAEKFITKCVNENMEGYYVCCASGKGSKYRRKYCGG